MEEALVNMYWGEAIFTFYRVEVLGVEERKSYKCHSVNAKQYVGGGRCHLTLHHIFLATQLSIHYHRWFQQQWKVTAVWKEEKRKVSV